MDLHSAGHRRGVVAAPHAAAAEAGRAVLAEGGNALEAMVAGAALVATSAVRADCRAPSGRVATQYSYRSNYAPGVSSYRSYYSGGGGATYFAPSYNYGRTYGGYGRSGIVEQESAYRRSLGKPM